MGRHPTGSRQYEIERIQEVHREIVRRLVLGQKPRTIARDLGISPQTVSNVRNSSIVRKEIARLGMSRDKEVEDISKQIREIAPIAVAVLETALHNEEVPWPVRFRAATDVLDRAGYGAVKKFQGVMAHLTKDEIEEIKRNAMKVGKESGIVVDNNNNGDDYEVEDVDHIDVSDVPSNI